MTDLMRRPDVSAPAQRGEARPPALPEHVSPSWPASPARTTRCGRCAPAMSDAVRQEIPVLLYRRERRRGVFWAGKAIATAPGCRRIEGFSRSSGSRRPRARFATRRLTVEIARPSVCFSCLSPHSRDGERNTVRTRGRRVLARAPRPSGTLRCICFFYLSTAVRVFSPNPSPEYCFIVRRSAQEAHHLRLRSSSRTNPPFPQRDRIDKYQYRPKRFSAFAH